MSFAAIWMDQEIIMLSEVNETQKENTIYHLYVESKLWHEWTYLQNRKRLTIFEKEIHYDYPRGNIGEGRG